MYDNDALVKSICRALQIVRSEQLSFIGRRNTTKRNNRQPQELAGALKATLAATVALNMVAQLALPVFAQDHATPSGTLLLPLTPKMDSDEETPSAIAPAPPAKQVPSGTLMLPLTPKMAEDPSSSSNTPTTISARKEPKKKIALSSSSATAKAIEVSTDAPLDGNPSTTPVPPVDPPSSPEDISKMLKRNPAGETEDPDEPDISKIDDVQDNTLLKGTVQIVADDTEYDQLKNTFLGTGSATATIAGQDAKLEADMILYDQATEMLDARGNVKITRQGQVSTGSSFKFKVSSGEYLITSPDTGINSTEVIARTGFGSKAGMRFREGTMQLANPVHIARNSFNGTLNSSYESYQKTVHPDVYNIDKPSFIFKARKMTYEKYKESANFTVFGGRLMFDKFGVPLGKFTATVGQGDQTHISFPMTPFVSNNLLVGGLNIGPMYNYNLPDERIFSWAPLIQYGGRIAGSTNPNIGAGFRIAFRGKKISANMAYGSVSNLFVADLKYKINKKQVFQAGINRYITAGLFGSQRARAIAEVVDTRGIGGIPFIQGISVRSSLALASDNPALLNQSPQYKALFNVNHTNIENGGRWQEQVMTSSLPFFAIGNQKYGITSNFFGGSSAAAYSTGDHLFMAEAGPVANVYLDRFRMSTSVLKAAVNGQSPFIFDQYLQGSTSGQLGGSFKVCKYLDIGGNLGYNFQNNLYYQKQVSAAIGPDDFKFLISHDTIRGINRFGFDLFYGQPIPFNKLIMKNGADQGQLASGSNFTQQ